MERPFLSIITINRNNDRKLVATLESVLSQKGLKRGELEYIIVDGASTDTSVDIIKEYANRTDFLHKISKWISEKDSGIYNAMNKGIKLATGEYIGILNSGDTFVEGAFDNLKQLALEHKDTILYGARNLLKDGQFLRTWAFDWHRLYKAMISHEGSFIPKSIYDKYGLYDESYKCCADWDFFLTLFQKGVPFFYVGKVVSNFDMSGFSNTARDIACEEDDRVRISHGYPPIHKKPKWTLGRVLKKSLKFCIPYGFLWLYWKLSCKR